MGSFRQRSRRKQQRSLVLHAAEQESVRNAEEEPCRVSGARVRWSRPAEIATRAECRSVRAAREAVWMRQAARLAGTVAVRVRSPVNCAEEHTESLVRSATERALCPTTASCATAERNVPSAAEQEWRSKHVNKLQKGDTTVMRYLLFYISDLLKNYCPAAAAAAACSFRTLISHCWLLIIDS